MLSNHRRRATTRLAAGSVLAATALASGAFAAIGTTAARADVTSGSQTANVATLTAAPVVTQQPQSVEVPSGTDATFTATADGSPTVQWQVSTDGGDTFTNIDGATSTSYTVTAPTTAQNGWLYQAVFTNDGGPIESDWAQLTVDPTAPVVTQQPADVTVQAGSPVSFTAAATGDPAVSEIQWEKSTDNGVSWQWIDGATSDTYTLTDMPTLDDNNTLFHVIYTNDVDSTTSNAAKLTVTGHVPSKPLNVAATQTGPGAFTIHWTAPFASGTPAMTGYQPGYSAGQMGNGEFVASSVHADTFKGLTPGKYVASVAAVNAAGSSVRVSVPVTIVAPSATPNAHVSATRVIAGGKFVLSGVGPANATLTIKRALPGKSFVKLTTVKTNSWGAYGIKIAALHTASYKVVTSAGKVSNKVTVVAPYAVHVRTIRTAVRAYTIKGWITPVAAGRTVHITATVAGKLVRIATVTTSSTGKYSTHYKFAKKGPVTVHVHVSSSALNAAGSTSKALTVS